MGDTWQLKYGITFDSLGSVTDSKMFRDIISYQNVLIASVAFNSILVSYDSGINWSSFNEGLISDWTFAGLAIKEPNLWALRDFFGNAYLRPLTNITDVEGENNLTPAEFNLEQNFPNPYNSQTTISYSIPNSSLVQIQIFDVLGREVSTLLNEEKAAGNYKINYNAGELTSGVYLYRLQAVDPEINSGQVFVQTRKMILLK